MDGETWLILILGVVILAVIIFKFVSKQKEQEEEVRYAAQMVSDKNWAMQKSFQELQKNGFIRSCVYKPENLLWAFSVDKGHKKWLISRNDTFLGEKYKPTIYNFSDLIDWSVSENGNTQLSSNAEAALGAGILFGAVGAVAASAGSREVQKTCSDLAIELTVNSAEQTRCTLKIIETEIPCDSDAFRSAMELVKNITAELAYIKANAEQPKVESPEQPEQKAIEQPQNNAEQQPSAEQPEQKPSGIYEEIETLYNLKQRGILTEEEFTQKKKSLLGI